MTTKPWTPPIIPARKPGWERGYIAALNHHMARPFIWRESDCMTAWADVCLAMTGVDPLKGLRRYGTEQGAARVIRRLGFTDVGEMVAAMLPPIEPLQARRGDVGICEQTIEGKRMPTAVIVMGDKAVGKGQRSPTFVPTLSLTAVYKVG